jgi:hypothetical protein
MTKKKKPETCCKCGKRYKHIRRSTQEEENGSWRAYPICRACWDGFLLVDANDAPVCDYCGDADCLREQWEDALMEKLAPLYPNARVVIEPSEDWETLKKTTWNSSGYEACPEELYDPDELEVEYEPQCPQAIEELREDQARIEELRRDQAP